MLRALDVKYMPCTAIKGQVLADFVAKFTKDVSEIKGLGLCTLVIFAPPPSTWEEYTNGAANQRGSRVGIVLVTLEKLVVEKSLRLGFSTTNNEAKYEALLARIEMVGKLGGEVLEIYLDSRLVIGQINREFEARDQRM